MNGIDPARVLDLFDQVPQFLGRISGQFWERCLLPQAGNKIGFESGRCAGG